MEISSQSPACSYSKSLRKKTKGPRDSIHKNRNL